MKTIFDHYRCDFSKIHGEFLNKYFPDLNEELLDRYRRYTVLDKNYPRPLLTLLGMNYGAEDAPAFNTCVNPSFLLIPQLLRDVLAIHDDIIDEDLEKFHQDTLPFAYGKIYDIGAAEMTKEGKDLALLFGDYLYPVIYDLVITADMPANKKIEIFACINDVMKETNIGQIDELVMQHTAVKDYTPEVILRMYQRKAANYCYAFPFTLGAIYGGAPRNVIEQTREMLLKLGAASQIIDDLMGVFPEALGESKFTLSDLLCLRRSYVLVLLAEKCLEDSTVQDILSLPSCTMEQALYLKEKIIRSGTLRSVVERVLADCEGIERTIDTLPVGAYCKSYFKKLVQSRVKDSLDQMMSFFSKGGE